ncbi:MAG: hydrogenase maturation peptidase HycI [Candidatus Bathyarchaeia archaeon]
MITLNSLENYLKKWFFNAKKIVIAGIGNSMRKDDAIGIEIVKKLAGKTPSHVYLLECENVPENFIGAIERINPTHILLIDSGQLNASPGSFALISPEQIGGISISTHTLPLSIFIKYIKQTINAKVIALVIQPKSLSFGRGLSKEVKKARDILAKKLLETLQSLFME